jgi:hypothetical protein
MWIRTEMAQKLYYFSHPSNRKFQRIPFSGLKGTRLCFTSCTQCKYRIETITCVELARYRTISTRGAASGRVISQFSGT